MKANGIWYLSTTKVKSHKFYHSHSDLGNPLDNEPLFTKGDFIRIDAGGHVYQTTLDNWTNCQVGSEYTGHRRAKWIKLDPNDYISLTGKSY